MQKSGREGTISPRNIELKNMLLLALPRLSLSLSLFFSFSCCVSYGPMMAIPLHDPDQPVATLDLTCGVSRLA